MRVVDQGSGFRVELSCRDTYDWAHKPGACWPGSTLAGCRIAAEFWIVEAKTLHSSQHCDLTDLAVYDDGGRQLEPENYDGHELLAIIQDAEDEGYDRWERNKRRKRRKHA